METMYSREFFTRKWIAVLLLLICYFSSYAQDRGLRSKWLPDYTSLQYAGSIGAVSLGAGYDIGKKRKTHLELHYGYTPKYDSDNRMSSITIKGLRTLVNKVTILGQRELTWIPLKTGLGLSYIADNRFFSFRTDLPYESGYYWHRTGLRSMAFFQTELVKSYSNKSIRGISYYMEANIQDIYVTLKLADSSFTVFDMIRLGMGVRFKF